MQNSWAAQPRSWRATLVFAGIGAFVTPAAARQDGTTTANCGGCHYGEANLRPIIGLPREPVTVEPGGQITIPVTLRAQGAEAFGVLVQSDHPLATDQAGISANELGLGHTIPISAPDGVLEWSFSFEAPQEVGISQIELAVVAALRNEDPENDSHVAGTVYVAHGCDPYFGYVDNDGDGFGSDSSLAVSCEPLESMVTRGGDCDDADPDRNPEAKERCNLIDDDCDGRLDNGLEPGLLYPDEDLDGFGTPRGTAEFGCAEEGKSLSADDCDDADGEVYPDAVELCNGVDDNCDEEVDNECVDEDDPGLHGSCSLGVPSAGMNLGGAGLLFAFLLFAGRRRRLRVHAVRGPAAELSLKRRSSACSISVDKP